MKLVKHKLKAALLCLVLGTPLSSSAFLLEFSAADFTVNPIFSNVVNFDFIVDIAGPLATGIYSNPTINRVDYEVSGSLGATPSGFLSFALSRPGNGGTLTGTEFYAQGSSLNFEIASSADLSDGLQLSELVGVDEIFVFNGREIDTGRYHPALFELNSDGTGTIQNSNNQGSTVPNPGSGQLVDVDFGEEYITDLSVDPNQLTLAAPVPLPPALVLLFSCCALVFSRRKS